MGTIRQAKLKPECAELYPTLPAGMWTSATHLAELVAPSRGAWPKPSRVADRERTLSEAEFEFRGGLPHWLGELVPLTRTGEPAFDW